jgi:hypothetical protein
MYASDTKPNTKPDTKPETSQLNRTPTIARQPDIKRLGAYLIDAGLITLSQVDVALNDQEFMDDGMRFGDVLVARGWVKQQTLDYLIEKVVEPEQLIARRVVLEESMTVRHDLHATPEVIVQEAPAVEPVSATANILAEARSLDGDAVFQVVLPPLEQTTRTDPTLSNQRRSLSSQPEEKDGLNWVG